MRNSKYFSLALLLLAAALILTACASPAPAAAEAPETTEAPQFTEAAPKTRTVPDTLTMEIFVGDVNISTKTQHFYDENGLLSQTISYSGDQETSRTELENDLHGEVIRQTTVSGAMTTVTESENTYDDAGNLIKKVDTVTMDGVITDIREYSYRPDGKLLEAIFTHTGENGYTTSNCYEYDEKGNQIAVIQESNGISIRTEAEFNEEGRIVSSVTINSDDTVTGRTEYTYDFAEDGTMTQTQTAIALPTGLSTRTVTCYDEQGNTILTETWTDDTLTQRISCTYITVPAFK